MFFRPQFVINSLKSVSSVCKRMASTSAKNQNFGILGMEIYFPKQYVAQEDLEKYTKVSAGKYTVGLGQSGLAFVNDREDIYSISMTALSNLMTKYNIDYNSVGRLEVATETIQDHSKAVKTYLMQLFEKSGNSDVEGIDCMNACYAGTNALFNSVSWLESSAWDGRYAVVVSADIAEYADGPARPTGGCGAVAFLLGPNAPIVLEGGVRGSHFEHAYDFYKPNLDSPYPVVDGKFSNTCYLRSLDVCYKNYMKKYEQAYNSKFRMSDADYVLFHAPYNKLVQKSFARMYYNDFKNNSTDEQYKQFQQYLDIPLDKSYEDITMEKAFLSYAKDDYKTKVIPSTLLPQHLGNMYTASLYAGLLSLLYTKSTELIDKRLLMFSYGSGLASTLFSMRVQNTSLAQEQLAKIRAITDLETRLSQRIRTDPEIFSKTMSIREQLHKVPSFECQGDKTFFDGTYYLTKRDDLGRRYYDRS